MDCDIHKYLEDNYWSLKLNQSQINEQNFNFPEYSTLFSPSSWLWFENGNESLNLYSVHIDIF